MLRFSFGIRVLEGKNANEMDFDGVTLKRIAIS